MVETFMDRCFNRGPTLDSYRSALDGTEQHDPLDRELERRRVQSVSPADYEQIGVIPGKPILMVKVTARRSGALPKPALTCEVIWSGTFPAGLPELLQRRLARPMPVADSFGDATVYPFLPAQDGGQLNPTTLDAVFLSNKPPLHSIVRMAALSDNDPFLAKLGVPEK